MPETTVVPSYRYYIADLLTGAIVMEVPFGQVSWERKITTAGSFSGSIAADENQNHFNLYNTTVPGKYALYVMRDTTCVWGGIIWGRDYNISDKRLNVSALEFTSYFFHRIYWKTLTIPDGVTVKTLIETLVSSVTTDQLSTDEYLGYSASDVHHVVTEYSITSGVATLTTEEPHNFVAGDVVRIKGVNSDINGDGKIVLGSTNAPTTYTFKVATIAGNTGGTISLDLDVANPYTILKSIHDRLQASSSINLDYSIDPDLDDYTIVSSLEADNPYTFRGSSMKYVGEILQNFSVAGAPSYLTTDVDQNLINTRFDYFVECTYDGTTYSFSNTFKAWLVQKDVNNPNGDANDGADLNTLYGPSKLSAGNLIFEHPGNISSLTLSENADVASTRTWVVDSANDLGTNAQKWYASYTNLSYLDFGWPILETAITDRDYAVQSDQEVAPYALALGYRLAPPIGEYSIVVDGSFDPKVGTYKPGDWCVVIPGDDFINFRLKPPYENRNGLLVRKIKSFKVSVPDNPSFPETVSLELVPEWEVTGG
jgi:hypothetical protein